MFRLATLDDGKITTAIVRQAIPWVSEGAQIFADGDRSLECELMQKRKVYLNEYFFFPLGGQVSRRYRTLRAGVSRTVHSL